MKTLNPLGGEHLWNVLQDAVKGAAGDEDVQFSFNGSTYIVSAGESFDSAKARVEAQSGYPLLSPDECAQKATEDLARMTTEQAEAIATAQVPTEREMREAAVPWPKTLDELTAYIKTLTDRPHDYGTCVYAMSMAATAAFYHVASMLGTTGFQASCADMDILRRTRGLKHGFRILDYENALYPQYWDDERGDIWRAILRNDETRETIAKAAREKLAEDNEYTHPNVLAHWRMLAESAALQ